MSLRKVALHLDISPWFILPFFAILVYRLGLSSIFLSVTGIFSCPSWIKPSNWSQAYCTIHSKLTFCEVIESYRTFHAETLPLCVCACLFLSGLYLTVALLKHCHSSGLFHTQLDATFLGFKLNIYIICTCIIMQVLNKQSVPMQMTPVSIWREQRTWKKTDLLLYTVV